VGRDQRREEGRVVVCWGLGFGWERYRGEERGEQGCQSGEASFAAALLRWLAGREGKQSKEGGAARWPPPHATDFFQLMAGLMGDFPSSLDG
jgi:hypothetical protein